MIIAYLNQKGGVGKTTLAVHTATALALDGDDVLLVDADPQGSALDWAATRDADPLFPVVGIPKSNLHRQLPQIASAHDVTVIDGPPSLADIARSAMMAADLVVIPIQPSPYDVWAAEEVVKLIEETRIYSPDLDAAFAVSRKIVNTSIGRDVTEHLERYELPVLPGHVCQRVAFAETAAAGMTVLETEPHSIAAIEIRDLAKAIRGRVAQRQQELRRAVA